MTDPRPTARGSTLQRPGAQPATPSAQPVDLLHFRLLERLGAGGMGVVYRAFDTKLRRDVALKVLSERYLADDRNRELILREARAAAGLVHANIGAIYELHETPTGAFFVMELVDGETLRQRLARGRIPLDDAVRWAGQIARGLACAHKQGIVHRDLKPDNVMIARSGEIKLLDFGLAKAIDLAEPAPVDAGDSPATLAPTLVAGPPATEAGRVMGTPAYMSPEQARGEPVDTRSDVFSFGVLVYELVTGAMPFARDGVPSGDPTSGDWKIVARVASPRTPRPLDALIQRCLAFDREARFADGAELGAALAALKPRASRRGQLAIAVAGVVAIGALAALVLRPSSDPPSACDESALDTRWTTAASARVQWELRRRRPGRRAGRVLGNAGACCTTTPAPPRPTTIRARSRPGDSRVSMSRSTRSAHSSTAGCSRSVPDARPALPPLDVCAGDAPDRVVRERPPRRRHGSGQRPRAVARRAPLRDRRRRHGRMSISTVDTGSEQVVMPVPDLVGFVGWVGDDITLASDKTVLRIDLAQHAIADTHSLPGNTWAVAPDGKRVLVRDGEAFSAITLADGSRSAPIAIADPAGPVSWSADDQIQLFHVPPQGPYGLIVVDLATGQSTTIPLRVDNTYIGVASAAWRGDTLLFSGRADAEHGVGVGSATTRHGRLWTGRSARARARRALAADVPVLRGLRGRDRRRPRDGAARARARAQQPRRPRPERPDLNRWRSATSIPPARTSCSAATPTPGSSTSWAGRITRSPITSRGSRSTATG